MPRILLMAACLLIAGCASLPPPQPTEAQEQEAYDKKLEEFKRLARPCEFPQGLPEFYDNDFRMTCADI